MRINIVCPATMCSTLMLSNFTSHPKMDVFVHELVATVRKAENPRTRVAIWDYANQLTIPTETTQVLRNYKVGAYGYIIASVPDHNSSQPWRKMFEDLGFTTACDTVQNDKNGTKCALMVCPAKVFMTRLKEQAAIYKIDTTGTSLINS